MAHEMKSPDILKNIEQYIKQNPNSKQQIINMQNQMKQNEYKNMTPRERLKAKLREKNNNRTSKFAKEIKSKKEEEKNKKEDKNKKGDEENSNNELEIEEIETGDNELEIEEIETGDKAV